MNPPEAMKLSPAQAERIPERGPGAPGRAAVRPDPACQWPEGDPLKDGFRFYNAPVARPGLPYCAAHIARAYSTPEDREADREAWLAVQRQSLPRTRSGRRGRT